MKANTFRSFRLVSTILVVLAVFAATGPVGAITSLETVSIIEDNNVGGVANIGQSSGDRLEFFCSSNSATPTVFVRCPALGITNLQLINIGGSLYSAIWPTTGRLPQGGVDNAVLQVQFYDSDLVQHNATVNIDNEPPYSPLGVTMGPAAPTGTTGKYIFNDQIQFYVDLNDADGQVAGRTNVVADLTNIGLGTNLPMTFSPGVGFGRYTLPPTTLPPNREALGQTFSIRAIDNAGNISNWAGAVSMDTRRPNLISVSAANTNGSSFVKVGDTVRVTAIIDNYDSDTVVASNSILFTPAIRSMPRTSLLGNTATYEISFVVASSTFQGNTAFDITATDDDGNTFTTTTNFLSFDTLPPGFSAIAIQILDPATMLPKGSTGRIGDILRVTATLSGAPTDIARVTMDLTTVGGFNNHLFTNLGAGVWQLDYTLNQYTSEDTIVRYFNVTARDTGGNVLTDIALPPVYIDNFPPSITLAALEKLTGSSWVKINDVIRFTANVSNIDGGSVTVNLSEIGGPISARLNPAGGSAFRYDFTLPQFYGTTPVDGNRQFTIRVTDNVTNLVTEVTNELTFDNEPPVITSATYEVTPAFSPTHPWVRSGDTVTFKVSLATPSATVHDGETVTINLSPLGYSSSQQMTYDGIGTYTYQVSVPAGTLDTYTNFGFTAKDNADNAVGGLIVVKVDNFAPVVGAMTVRWLVDYNNADVINLGDRMEFVVPCADPDGGSCTIDLSYVGSSAFSLMNYDPAILAYTTIIDTATASNESGAYVFRARVTDKAGNLTSSLSGPFSTDCVEPVMYGATATFQDLVGSSTVVNVGDKVSITASVQNSRLDGGLPRVSLTEFGLPSNQQLFDDGAHGDGAPNDGVWGFEFTTAKGTINGANRSFAISITDNAGNGVSRTTNSLFIDNQPLAINYYLASINTDTNGNSTADLNGQYGISHTVTTDSVRLSIRVTGADPDFGTCTVDITKLGYPEVASQMPVLSSLPGQRDYEKIFVLQQGTTNRELVTFTTNVTDVNGNPVFATATPQLMVDNFPPVITQLFPITFVTDSIPTGEANLGDKIQFKVRVSNHDGTPPEIDFGNLLAENGLSSSSPIVQMVGGPSDYTYTWTTPEGLGSLASLPILVWDASKNLKVSFTNSIRFLSTKPVIMGYSASKATLSSDTWPTVANNIANPGDEVTIKAVLSKAFNPTNTPPAVVCADIRSIASDTSDDFAGYLDGDPKTYWIPLIYQALESGAGSFVYRSSYQVGTAGRIDTSVASFAVKVLHPDYTSIVMASGTINCDPLNPFGIDTLVPNIYLTSIRVSNENGDNVSSSVANIGDVITVNAKVADYADPGSGTVFLYASSSQLIDSQVLSWTGVGDLYSADFVVGTDTVVPWNLSLRGAEFLPGDFLRYGVHVTDDADNVASRPVTYPGMVSTFTVDNTPPNIILFQSVLNPNNPFNWVGNVGSAPAAASDAYIASISVDSAVYQAWIDLSPIQASTTWLIINNTAKNPAVRTGVSAPLNLATASIEAAITPFGNGPSTFTLPIYVRDLAGNALATSTQFAFDTTRPYVTRAEYDGQYLWLWFNEYLMVGDTAIPMIDRFDHRNIRLSKKSDLSLADASHTIQLGGFEYIEEPGLDTDQIRIVIASGTRATIADWGNVSLWMSMGTSTSNGEGASTSVDLAGNWMRPIKRNLSTQVINIPVPYAIKPNLIGGRYDAVNDPENLYLYFDKDMASDTFTNDSIRSLAVVRTRTNDSLPVDYTKRYTMIVATDTVLPPYPNAREMVIDLSDTAKDWIAIKYGRLGSFLNYSVATTPIMIRDLQGNRVNTITFENATQAYPLTPVNSNFNVNNGSVLDIGSKTLDITVDRRARLFADDYQVNAPIPAGKTTTNVITSRIFLYKNSNLAGPSIALSRSTAPGSINDYASTSVHIQLSDDDIRDILSWNTATIYMAINDGAFRDLWANPSNRYPLSGTTGLPVTVITPTTYPNPVVAAVAVSDPSPTLSYAPGLFFYEVDVRTASIPPNIQVPVNRDLIPTLQVKRQIDDAVVDVGSFVTWITHTVGSEKYTVARFVNTMAFPSDAAYPSGYPGYVEIGNIQDVFAKPLNPTPTLASFVYAIGNRTTTGTGWSVASLGLLIDSNPPIGISATPNNQIIGITPASTLIFSVTFNEGMDPLPGRNPTLRLGTVAGTVMNFQFESWLSSSTARFYNTAAFNENTDQGSFTYFVSGGYDLAGNKGNDNVAIPGQLEIRSKGPVINAFSVTTHQFTTSKENWPTGGFLTDKPYSPYVPNNPTVLPGIATITVSFASTPAAGLYLHFYQGNTSLASYPVQGVGATRFVEWDGRFNGVAIGLTGPTTYEIRVFDTFNNEGSRRGTIIYDGNSPKVLNWSLTHASPVRWDGKVYFSPAVHSYVKVDTLGPAAGEEIRMRALNPGLTTDTYVMSPLTGGGYTYSWDGRSTDAGNPQLVDGEYLINVVDAAGNVGIPLGVLGVATSTIVVDKTAPVGVAFNPARTDNGSATTRFNPNVTSLDVNVSTGDPTVSSGTAMVRIKAGATVVRDIYIINLATPFKAVWDGRDKNNNLVVDGTYRIYLIDLAENQSTEFVDVEVVSSLFKVSAVTEVDKRTVRVTFSQPVNISDAGTAGNYTLSPNSPSGIGAQPPLTVTTNDVIVPLNLVMTHGTTYTLTVSVGFRSLDGDTLLAGNNSAQFTADTLGPVITNITYDGVTTQQEFNVVFDESLNATSATNVGYYTLQQGTDTLPISAITLRQDGKSVKVTTTSNIAQGLNYTIVASGVEDLYRNQSDGAVSQKTFTGRDVTPPVITVSVFSNPGNEYDISIAVLSNEDLGGAPTVNVTQSGGTTQSIVLSAGPSARLYLGGTHLDKNFPGVATIKVTAKDVSGNSGVTTISFSTAFVNANIRAEVLSADLKFAAVFPAGALKQDSLVTVVSTPLTKVAAEANKAAGIRPSILASTATGKTSALLAAFGDGIASDELVPVDQAYMVNIPAGRLQGNIEVSLQSGSELPAGLALFRQVDGKWIFAGRKLKDSRLVAVVERPGLFALMRDEKAPRATLLTKIVPEQPMRSDRPSIEWSLAEEGSGLDHENTKALLNGVEMPVQIDLNTGKTRFVPTRNLVSGEYRLSLQVCDKAGNMTVTPEIRFKQEAALKIFEISQFPNPASRRTSIRFATNRADIDSSLIEVTIYDMDGDRVATGRNLMISSSNDGTRAIHDVLWDLTNDEGQKVANGVYFARISLRDPDNSEKKTKVTQKIAVLR